MVRYQTSTWQGKSRAVPMSDLISWNVRPIESYPIPVLSFAVTRVVLLDNQGSSRLSCNSVLYYVHTVTLSHLSYFLAYGIPYFKCGCRRVVRDH